MKPIAIIVAVIFASYPGHAAEDSAAGRAWSEVNDHFAQNLVTGDKQPVLGLQGWAANEQSVRTLAAQGDPVANNTLGVALAKGLGGRASDPAAACVCWQRAADKGGAAAMTNLGRAYQCGKGAEASPAKAVEWFRKAAELGDTQAMISMGYASAKGLGMERSDREALEWFDRAMLAGNSHAQGFLEPLLREMALPKPLDLANEATRRYEQEGTGAALAYLDRNCPPVHALCFPDYERMIWREAQTVGGRRHPDWSGELFRWLYEKCDRGRRWIHGSQSNQLLLLVNVASAFNESGRMGLASYYSERLRRTTEEMLGMEFDVAKFADRGPLNTVLPEVRMRAFPTTAKNPNGEVVEIRRGHMGAAQIAGMNAEITGDWKRQAECGVWRFQWAEWKLARITDLDDTNEIRDILVRGLMSVADVYTRLGFHDMASSNARQVLGIYGQGHPKYYGGHTAVRAERCLLREQIALGKATEDIVAKLERNALRERKNAFTAIGSWIEAEVLKVDALFQIGHDATGWKELDVLLQEMESKELPISETEVLKCWIRHSLDSGRLAGVEDKLKAALVICRRSGYKTSEPELYSLYARYLQLSGNLQQAIAMELEAIRLYQALDLYTLVVLERRKLAEYYLAAGQSEAADRELIQSRKLLINGRIYPDWIIGKANAPLEIMPGKKDSSDPRGIYLQPEASHSAPLAGLNARTTMTLTHSSSKSRKGILRVTGAGTAVVYENGWLRCSFLPGAAIVARDQEVVLDASQPLMIELATKTPPSKEGGEVEVSFIENGEPGPVSNWHYAETGDGRTTAMIDAHSLADNPFYLLPVGHSIQALNGRQLVNLRARASVPTRIEAYLPNGELLFIDADGNGSFSDHGDVVFHDVDADGFPDITLKDRATSLDLTFYYEPPKEFETIQIDHQTQYGGEWSFDSQDSIRGPGARGAK